MPDQKAARRCFTSEDLERLSEGIKDFSPPHCDEFVTRFTLAKVRWACQDIRTPSTKIHLTTMETFSTTLLTNEELVASAGQILPVIDHLFAGDSVLLAIGAATVANVNGLNLAATREPGSEVTGEIEAADELRDNAFTTLRDFTGVWANNRHAPAPKREAGQRLRAIFAKHGNSIHRKGYTKQTGAMQPLLTDLASETSLADMATLDLLTYHTDLVKAQAAFEKVWEGKSDDSGKAQLPTLGDHLPALKRRLNLLLAVADEWSRIDPPASTAPLFAKLDGLIAATMTPVHARGTREKKAAAKSAKPGASANENSSASA